jgi:hypothetical protein
VHPPAEQADEERHRHRRNREGKQPQRHIHHSGLGRHPPHPIDRALVAATVLIVAVLFVPTALLVETYPTPGPCLR